MNERQPLILPEESWEVWMNPASEPEELLPLIQTWDDLVTVAPAPPPRRSKSIQLQATEEQLELDW